MFRIIDRFGRVIFSGTSKDVVKYWDDYSASKNYDDQSRIIDETNRDYVITSDGGLTLA